MRSFKHDGISFNYRDIGEGLPFVFQHGLGGDVNQPCDLLQPPAGIRLLACDCRAHGKTEPLGPTDKIAIASFADDLAALLDYLEIERAVVGGISMGAAVSVNFTLRRPARVLGLVQSRPAWLAGPNHDNVRFFTYVAQLLREHGPSRGREIFCESEIYREVLDDSADSASSLAGQFDNEHAVKRSVRLERIPLDAPYQHLDQLSAVRVPTIVLANREDPIHPFQYGEIMSQKIPRAEFRELTSKSINVDQHAEEVQRFITEFLGKHFA